jgi:hypothetical protein
MQHECATAAAAAAAYQYCLPTAVAALLYCYRLHHCCLLSSVAGTHPAVATFSSAQPTLPVNTLQSLSQCRQLATSQHRITAPV